MSCTLTTKTPQEPGWKVQPADKEVTPMGLFGGSRTSNPQLRVKSLRKQAGKLERRGKTERSIQKNLRASRLEGKRWR